MMNTINGTSAGEVLNGTDGHDVINADGGNDIVYGGNGSDWLYGGAGNDVLIGGAGFNTFYGGAGRDVFFAHGDNDQIEDFKQGVDKIDVSTYGISSFDQVSMIFDSYYYTATHFESLTIAGIASSKLLATDFVFDTSGARNASTENGGNLYGSREGDVLRAKGLNANLYGGDGDDTLIADEGFNNLFGQRGNDIFAATDRRKLLSDSDSNIIDFSSGSDKIDLSGLGIASFDQLKLILQKQGTADSYFYIWHDNHVQSFTVYNITPGSFRASDFIFDKKVPTTVTGTDRGDHLFGSAASETVNGGAGSDRLYGGAGNDRLVGGTGMDTLYGQAGSDIFVVESRESLGEPSRDTIMDFQQGSDKIDLSGYGISDFKQLSIMETKDGRDTYINAFFEGEEYSILIKDVLPGSLTAADFLFYNGAARDISGDAHDDRLFGSALADRLKGNHGDDQLFGGAGNDTLVGGYHKNTLSGQTGNDLFVLQTRVDDQWSNDTITDFKIGSDKVDLSQLGISSFEQVLLLLENVGSKSSSFNAFYNDAEYRVTFTNVKADSFRANDFIFASDSSRMIRATDGNDTIFGRNRDDKLDGKDGDDVLFGGGGNDILLGGAGGNYLYGQAGNDIFAAQSRTAIEWTTSIIQDFEEGADKIDVSAWGVSSFDQVLYILETVGKDVHLTANYKTLAHTFRIMDTAVDEFKASDFIYSDGGVGSTIRGTRSFDTLFGTTGDDVMFGDGGDVLLGGDGDDTLYGSGINSVLVGGRGADKLIGSTVSSSTVSYKGATHGVVADLKTPKNNTAEALGDTYLSIENLRGSSHNDTLTGDRYDNEIQGDSGNDRIFAGEGSDVITGGAGRDFLVGGSGSDIFVFDFALGRSNIDTIDDFRVRDDVIALAEDIFARIDVGFDVPPGSMTSIPKSAFHSGAESHDKNDRIIYDKLTGKLFYDADGTGKAEAVVFAQLDKGLALTSANFDLIG